MTRCKAQCVEIVSGTNRDKWNYVRSLYFGQRTENRLPDDPSRIADELYEDQTFTEDQAVWLSSYSSVPFERFMQWYYERGTYQYNNLPDWKKDDHEGHCYALCPYDSACNTVRIRHMLDLSISDPLPIRVAHGNNYMKTASRGSKWGFECVFDGCPYYITTGQRYFYV